MHVVSSKEHIKLHRIKRTLLIILVLVLYFKYYAFKAFKIVKSDQERPLSIPGHAFRKLDEHL